MARGNLTVTNTTRAGVAIGAGTAGDVANGHQFVNDGKSILVIQNTDSASRTAHVAVHSTPDGQAVTPKPVVVAAGAYVIAGPWSVGDYGSLVLVDVDAASGVTTKLSVFHVS